MGVIGINWLELIINWNSTPAPISSLLVKSSKWVKTVLKGWGGGAESRDLIKLTEAIFQKQLSEYLQNQSSGGCFEGREIPYKMTCVFSSWGFKKKYNLFLIMLMVNILKVIILFQKQLWPHMALSSWHLI